MSVSASSSASASASAAQVHVRVRMLVRATRDIELPTRTRRERYSLRLPGLVGDRAVLSTSDEREDRLRWHRGREGTWWGQGTSVRIQSQQFVGGSSEPPCKCEGVDVVTQSQTNIG